MNESKAARHQRRQRRGVVRSWAAAACVLGAMALTPAGRFLHDLSVAATAGLPGPIREVAAVVAFDAGIALACVAAVMLVASGRDEADRGVSAPEAEAASWRVLLLGGLLLLPVVVVCGFVVRGAAGLAGSGWWPIATLVLAALLAIVLRVGPRVLRAGRAVRPLSRPGVAERTATLAARAGVSLLAVAEFRQRDTSAMVAMVAGTGRRRQILLASDVVRDWSEDEVMALVAHELAHLAHGDLLRSFALDVAVLGLGLLTSEIVLRAAGPSLGLDGAGDPAAMPLIALSALGIWLFATPVRRAQSRRHERRADAFALRLTGRADAFATALRRAAARRLVDDRPGRIAQWLFHRHPPIAERLAAAERFRQEGADLDQPGQRPPSTISVP